MKILVVTHEFPPLGGGGANACYYLTNEYAGAGHEVTIITAGFQNLAYEEKHGNIKIIRVKALRKREEKSTFFEMLTYLYSALRKAGQLAEQERFDVCQVFFGIPSGPVGIYLKKKYRMPYVVRFGGGDIPGTQKRFSIVYKLLAPAIRCIWKNADALVANSEDLQQRALRFESRYPVTIIHNGVDVRFFARSKQAVTQDRTSVNILFVSRLIERKGLQHIIPHMQEINDRAGRKVKLTIVGDGPYRSELEKLAEQYRADSFIRFEGSKNKTELKDYYEDADLFILPSAWEGMPNVVLEAMAMGVPVVMTPCGGSAELIRGNGVTASIDGFVDAVIDLCRNDQKRIEMGKISESLARERFCWREKAGEYLETFANLRIQGS